MDMQEAQSGQAIDKVEDLASPSALAATQAGDRCGASRTGGGLDAAGQGAPSSNTAPYNCNGEYFKALRWGVDSLYLSVKGKLNAEVVARLKQLKAMAQSRDNPEDQAIAQYPIKGEIFQVKDKGAGRFPYVLDNSNFRIQLSLGQGLMPMAYVKVSATLLAYVGPREAMKRLEPMLSSLGDIEGIPVVSRIDLFVDFVWTGSMEWDRSAWVTRAKQIDAYSENDRFTGWVVGRGGHLLGRLYDKKLQSDKIGAYYLQALWDEVGWKEHEPVWRLEFQIKREILSEFGLSGLDSVLNYQAGLWSYVTAGWLRLALPQEGDQTRSRWPIHPLWGYLSSVDWEGNGGPLLRSNPAPVGEADYQRLYARFLSVLVCFTATRNYESLAHAHHDLMQESLRHYRRKADYEGTDLTTLVFRKVRLKARDYGTTLNDPDVLRLVDQRAQDDLAAIYRAASRGG
jgi:hypothetical protein